MTDVGKHHKLEDKRGTINSSALASRGIDKHPTNNGFDDIERMMSQGQYEDNDDSPLALGTFEKSGHGTLSSLDRRDLKKQKKDLKFNAVS